VGGASCVPFSNLHRVSISRPLPAESCLYWPGDFIGNPFGLSQTMFCALALIVHTYPKYPLTKSMRGLLAMHASFLRRSVVECHRTILFFQPRTRFNFWHLLSKWKLTYALPMFTCRMSSDNLILPTLNMVHYFTLPPRSHYITHLFLRAFRVRQLVAPMDVDFRCRLRAPYTLVLPPALPVFPGHPVGLPTI